MLKNPRTFALIACATPVVIVSVLAGTAVAAQATSAGPESRSARAKVWSGIGGNDLAAASALFTVRSGKVSIRNMQFVMACTDAVDGSESARAFDFSRSQRVALRGNRYRTSFAVRSSEGDVGEIRLSGNFKSRGRGSVVLSMSAAVKDSETQQTLENCGARVTFRIHR